MLIPIFLVLTVFSMWFNRSLCVVLSILVSLDLDNPKIESLDQFLTQLFKVCDFSFRISNNLGHNIVVTGLNVQVMVYLFSKRRINGQTIKFKPHSLLHPSLEHLKLFQIQHITYNKYLHCVSLLWQIWEVYELTQFNDWHIFIYLITLSTANLYLIIYYWTNLHSSYYILYTANLYLVISKKTLKCLKN